MMAIDFKKIVKSIIVHETLFLHHPQIKTEKAVWPCEEAKMHVHVVTLSSCYMSYLMSISH